MNKTETQTETTERTVALLETITVFLWLLLDGLWLFEWRMATYASSAVCIVVCFSIFSAIERKPVLLLIASADTAWLCMNIFWAIGDFEHSETMLTIAKACYLISLTLFGIAIHLGNIHKGFAELVLRRMRLLQILRKR